MVHLDASLAEQGESGDKGLKEGALGFVSSVVVGVASTAPAYSLAATLGFVVIAIDGLQAPIITILAFVPMLFISYGYKALNAADPDCGTTFTWATRAFGPEDGLAGWLGDRRRRHPRDGQPGPDRRPVRVPALRRQRHRTQRGQRVGAAGRDHVDRGHDRHLLRRDRDLGQLPEGAPRHRAGHAHGALGGGPRTRWGRARPPSATSPPAGPGSTRSPFRAPRASWSVSPSCCSSIGAGTPPSR